MNRILFTILFNAFIGNLQSQPFDLLLKNGRIIDSKNNINKIADIALKENKIALIKENIRILDSKKTIDVKGMIVCAGLIDMHTHVFVGSHTESFANGINSISPDNFSLRAGITTVVDAGTSGYKNFIQFKSQVIDKSKTRILAFLNIAAYGMTGNEKQEDINEMNVDSALSYSNIYKDQIVGIKIGHVESHASWDPFDKALDVCNKLNKPLFVECHLPHYTLEQQLNKMRPGDIITHTYEKVKERASVIDERGNLRSYVVQARDKGILFDLGHGGAGFWYSEAIPALKQGLWPNSFGTDMHRFSVNAGMKDMLNVMSKFMAMGLSLEEVITRATWYPAKSILHDDIGSLTIGNIADITVLSIRKGKFGYFDAGGNRVQGKTKLECELTIRNGQIVWDLNGLAAKSFVYKK